jgi:hypothetical protein
MAVRRSTSQQQDNQDDQKDRAKPAADIRATIIEATATEQEQENDDKDD